MSILETLRRGGYVTQLQGGKDFILFPGLLWAAHENGIKSIITKMIEHDPQASGAVFRSVATGSRGTFTGHGDASPSNLSRNLIPSYLRMAETRAIGRSLRFYLGIGMTAANELPSQEEPRIDPSNEGRPPEQEPAQAQAPEPAQNGAPIHDSSWEDDRKRFCASVAQFGGYDAVAFWAEGNNRKGINHGRPSSWTTNNRDRLLAKLESGEIQIIPF